MKTFFTEIAWRTPQDAQQRVLAAVCAEDGQAESAFAQYIARAELTLLTSARFIDVLEIARSGKLTPLHSQLAHWVGLHRPVRHIVLEEGFELAPADTMVRQGFNELTPLLIVFNVAENLNVYLSQPKKQRGLLRIASYAESFGEQFLPATVAAPFMAWTPEAIALYAQLRNAYVLSDPALAMLKPSGAPMFRLMANERWSLPHPLDPYWAARADLIEFEPEDTIGIKMFRPRSQEEGGDGFGYIGRARFVFPLAQHEVEVDADPECASQRIVNLACETALADIYLRGVNLGFLPTAIRRQSGIVQSAQFGPFDAMRAQVEAPMRDAVHRYRVRDGHQLNYRVVQLMAKSFAIAAEKGILAQASKRWADMCDYQFNLPSNPDAEQLASVFYMETCQ